MAVLNFASPKWVYMLKSVEKWHCKSRKYKTEAGNSILNYATFVPDGHFEVLFLKIHNISFLWSRLPKHVRSTLNLIAHEMTLALPLKGDA
jgi:hypothetical protein